MVIIIFLLAFPVLCHLAALIENWEINRAESAAVAADAAVWAARCVDSKFDSESDLVKEIRRLLDEKNGRANGRPNNRIGRPKS